MCRVHPLTKIWNNNASGEKNNMIPLLMQLDSKWNLGFRIFWICRFILCLQLWLHIASDSGPVSYEMPPTEKELTIKFLKLMAHERLCLSCWCGTLEDYLSEKLWLHGSNLYLKPELMLFDQNISKHIQPHQNNSVLVILLIVSQDWDEDLWNDQQRLPMRWPGIPVLEGWATYGT